MGVGRFVYIDKMFSRRFVDSIINKRNTPTPCRDLSPPPLGGVYPPCTTPHYQIPHWGYTKTHTHWSDPPPPSKNSIYKPDYVTLQAITLYIHYILGDQTYIVRACQSGSVTWPSRPRERGAGGVQLSAALGSDPWPSLWWCRSVIPLC